MGNKEHFPNAILDGGKEPRLLPFAGNVASVAVVRDDRINVFFRVLVRLLLLILLVAQPMSFLSLAAPDIDSSELSSSFWNVNGEIFNLPLLGSDGKLHIRQTKFYTADTGLLSGHVVDGKGNALPHIHFRDDYHQSKDIQDANRYWDAKCDCPRLTERQGDASVKLNNFAQMFKDQKLGRCDHWISESVFMKAIEAKYGDLKMISYDETDSSLASSPEEVGLAEPAPSGMVDFRFKLGASGTYQVKRRAFDLQSLVVEIVEPK